MAKKLFSPAKFGLHNLKNRCVMAPMTRSRGTSAHVPTEIMGTYYTQRAGAGLIITEGTSPSLNGAGYARIPGIYNNEQVEAWAKIVQAVHERSGVIFVQLMHTGRIGHSLNLQSGGEVLGPSAIAAAGLMYTDQQGMQEQPVPGAMTKEDVKYAIEEFVTACRNAMLAGFDGVELHAANGYLIEQFLNPHSNTRTDEYGGSIENRGRILLEIVEKAGAVIGKEKIGVRLSPYGVSGDMKPYDELEVTYHYLADQLNRAGIFYLHVLDHSSMGSPTVPAKIFQEIRQRFHQTIIRCGGFDAISAEEAVEYGDAELVAFGRMFLANPDLVDRMERGGPFNHPEQATFYTPGEKGYTDYPVLKDMVFTD